MLLVMQSDPRPKEPSGAGPAREDFAQFEANGDRREQLARGALAVVEGGGHRESLVRSPSPGDKCLAHSKWPGAGCGHRTPAGADNPGKKSLPAPPPTVSSRALECKPAGAAPRPQRPLVAPDPPIQETRRARRFLRGPQGFYKEHREPRMTSGVCGFLRCRPAWGEAGCLGSLMRDSTKPCFRTAPTAQAVIVSIDRAAFSEGGGGGCCGGSAPHRYFDDPARRQERERLRDRFRGGAF
jgi:hypothetical protein